MTLLLLQMILWSYNISLIKECFCHPIYRQTEMMRWHHDPLRGVFVISYFMRQSFLPSTMILLPYNTLRGVFVTRYFFYRCYICSLTGWSWHAWDKCLCKIKKSNDSVLCNKLAQKQTPPILKHSNSEWSFWKIQVKEKGLVMVDRAFWPLEVSAEIWISADWADFSQPHPWRT